jgi:hypothetical protein
MKSNRHAEAYRQRQRKADERVAVVLDNKVREGFSS